MSDIHKDYYDLHSKYKEIQKEIGYALNIIYCIGGPLNDNVKNYNKDQLNDFMRIAMALKAMQEPISE